MTLTSFRRWRYSFRLPGDDMPARFIILTALLLTVGHWALRSSSISWLPLPMTAAVVIAFTAERPLRYLIGLAVLGELLSALPGGVLTAAILLPWVVRKFRRENVRTMSASWLGVVAATVLLQLIILFAPGLTLSWRSVPWPAAAITWLASSIVLFFLTAGYTLLFAEDYER